MNDDAETKRRSGNGDNDNNLQQRRRYMLIGGRDEKISCRRYLLDCVSVYSSVGQARGSIVLSRRYNQWGVKPLSKINLPLALKVITQENRDGYNYSLCSLFFVHHSIT